MEKERYAQQTAHEKQIQLLTAQLDRASSGNHGNKATTKSLYLIWKKTRVDSSYGNLGGNCMCRAMGWAEFQMMMKDKPD